MAETQEELNELWAEFIDCIEEIKGDLKEGVRSHRHFKNLKIKANEVGTAITKLAGSKRGFLR
jgi:hypothetical protein